MATVLITGASGTLGLATAEAFHAAGWRVLAGARSGHAALMGKGFVPVQLDVASAGDVAELRPLLEALEGGVDALVNNAGASQDGPVWSLSGAAWEASLAVNLKGAFLLSKACAPYFPAEGGQVVNISSFAGVKGSKGQGAYAAAKAGLIGLTQSLAREWASKNIRVNAILPGVMRSGMTHGLTGDQWDALVGENLLKRENSPAEVAKFILFLMGTANISGQVFQLDSRLRGG